MSKKGLTSFRSWEQSETEVDRERKRVEGENTRVYGRPDISSVVKVAVQRHAESERCDCKAALESLIRSAGTYEQLLSTLTKEAARFRAKQKKKRKLATALKGESPGLTIYKNPS